MGKNSVRNFIFAALLLLPTAAFAQNSVPDNNPNHVLDSVSNANPNDPNRENAQTKTKPIAVLRPLEGRENADNIDEYTPPKLSKNKLNDIQSKIDALFKQKPLANTDTGVYVIDLETGQTIYSRQADKALKPASNMKLLTTAAAMHILGAEHRFETKLYANGDVTKDGTLKGDLHMHIDHDFTWSDRFYATGSVPMENLILQLKQAGVKKITGNVIVSGYVVYGGMPTNTLNAAYYLTKATTQFGKLLRQAKITSKNPQAQSKTKPKGKVIATWLSPTLSEASVPLNRASHNEYADMLLMAIGSHAEGKSSFEAGAKAEKAWLKKIGLDSKKIIIKDGSGLSHDNRLTPEFLTKLTHYMLQTDYATAWAASLSIAGYDGTYGGRLQGLNTKGRVLVKSGSLRDVISGSGFLVNAHDGRTYAFSILVNQMKQKKATRQAIDRVVQAFAGKHFDTEILPAPQMLSLKQEGEAVVARWKPQENVKGYRLWMSEDGQVWKPENSVFTLQNMASLPLTETKFAIHVTSIREDGTESLPSLTFGYAPGPNPITIVEAATCRWEEQTRPVNRLFSHERALFLAMPQNRGVQTVTPANIPENHEAIFWHGGVCQSNLQNDDETLTKLWKKDSPLIVNNFERHVLTSDGTCAPEIGKFQGCFGSYIIGKDRRVGDLKQNYRLRKASGTGNGRPTTVIPWAGAQGCLNIGKTSSIAACSANHAIIGMDLQAMDSLETQKIVLETVKNAIKPK